MHVTVQSLRIPRPEWKIFLETPLCLPGTASPDSRPLRGHAPRRWADSRSGSLFASSGEKGPGLEIGPVGVRRPISPGQPINKAHHEKVTGNIHHPVHARAFRLRAERQPGSAPACRLLRPPVSRRHPGDIRLCHDRGRGRYLLQRRLVVEAVGRAVVHVQVLRPRLERLHRRPRILS